MVISLVVYLIFNKFLPNKEKTDAKSEIQFNSSHFIAALGALVGAGLIFSFILAADFEMQTENKPEGERFWFKFVTPL